MDYLVWLYNDGLDNSTELLVKADIWRDIPLVLPAKSDVIIWPITSMCDITKILKIWLRHHTFWENPKIRGRICANSKYVLKFDLGLGCIKHPDDKNAKAKSGFDGWDGMGWQYICRCPSSKCIIYILYTLPGWHNMLPPTHVVARSNRTYEVSQAIRLS